MRELKLNIGCGRNVVAGWVNIDNSPSALLAKLPFLKRILFRLKLLRKEYYDAKWSKNIVWYDVLKGLPYADKSVSKIYSSHFLEHLDKEQGGCAIKECFRVLKEGGIIRLVVPDLVFHANRYIQKVSGQKSAGSEAHDEFLRNIYGAYLEKRRPGASHRYMYDYPTLRMLLEKTGFNRVICQKYRISEDKELSVLDNRQEDSLHMDAIK